MPRTRDKATLLLPQAGRKRKYFSEGARARARVQKLKVILQREWFASFLNNARHFEGNVFSSVSN